ncbi:MAG: head GIN domain-containing protein [Bacteroidota bacterium]
MKTNFLVIATTLLLNTASYGCWTKGSGRTVTETRELETFSGIELKSSANIYITQGDKQEVRVEAEDNLISKITTRVKNNSLIVDTDDNVSFTKPVTIHITVKDLCLIDLTGSGNIVTRSQFQCEFMSLKLSGSGDIRVMLDSKSLKANLSGSGNLDMKGSSSETDIRISGSGNVDARGLNSFSSAIAISGSGTSTVDVKNDLNVTITGSGNVFYVEEPGHISSKIIGSGEISKLRM